MSNSSLVNYTLISPNKNIPRKHKIDKITIHHMAGNLTVEQCGKVFASKTRKASANYGIGTDGRVGLYVDEKDRSWASSSAANDNRAVTIEVANDVIGGNWHVSDVAYNKLIELCVDICKRNGIPKLVWTGDKNGTLTVHRMFASTACPGPYLYSKMPEIAAEVNRRLAQPVSAPAPNVTSPAATATSSSSTTLAPAQSHNNAKIYAKGKTYTTIANLNIRYAPSTSAKTVASPIPKGKKVTWYGYYTGDWFLVIDYRGKTGYVHKAYLK